VVDLKEVRTKRSLDQNKYFHVLCGLFGVHFGYTIYETKQLLKDRCEGMEYEKNGVYFQVSTASLNTKEMTDFINWIRNYSAKHGCYLPTPDEYRSRWWEYAKEIEKNREFL